VYQGEELGLPEVEVPFESLQDPYGIAFWPNFKGRDGCRTPMPWDESELAGFTEGRPWLPVPEEHRALAVSRQAADPGSVLNGFRTFQHWRRQQPALRWGAIRFLDTPEPVLAFLREFDGERVLAAFNLSDAAVQVELPDAGTARTLDGHGLPQGRLRDGRLELPPHGLLFARLSD